MADVHGTCDGRFEAVREALASSLDRADVGASAAVYLDSEPVVDLCSNEDRSATSAAWRSCSRRTTG